MSSDSDPFSDSEVSILSSDSDPLFTRVMSYYHEEPGLNSPCRLKRALAKSRVMQPEVFQQAGYKLRLLQHYFSDGTVLETEHSMVECIFPCCIVFAGFPRASLNPQGFWNTMMPSHRSAILMMLDPLQSVYPGHPAILAGLLTNQEALRLSQTCIFFASACRALLYPQGFMYTIMPGRRPAIPAVHLPLVASYLGHPTIFEGFLTVKEALRFSTTSMTMLTARDLHKDSNKRYKHRKALDFHIESLRIYMTHNANQ